MKTIRKGVFETNSSSTNSFVFGKVSNDYVVPKELKTGYVSVGRYFSAESPEEKLTVLLRVADNNGDLNICLETLFKLGIENIILNSNYTDYWAGSEINDPEELLSIIQDPQEIKNWLFSPESEISGEDDN